MVHNKRIILPRQDPETGEWRYNGKWYDEYPSDELGEDEAALDEHWDREFQRQRED